MIFAGRGDEAAVHPLILDAQHHHHVRPVERGVEIAIGRRAHAFDIDGHQRRRRDHAHLRAQRGERQHVGASDPAVQHVAADGDDLALDIAAPLPDGQRVEQRLRRMLMPAVARVEHRAVHLVGDQLHRARTAMADDDHVGAHGVQRDGGVDQRLALLHARLGGVHVDDIRAQSLARDFERQQRAGAVFEKGVDLGEALQPVVMLARGGAVDADPMFGLIEQKADFPRL